MAQSIEEPVRADPEVVLPGRAFWWLALAFVVVALVGRGTVIHEDTPGVVWPAAGAGLLWLLVCPAERRWTVAGLSVMAAALVGVHLVTDAPPGLVAASVAAGLTQTGVGVALVRRWCPDLLGAGGTGTVDGPRRLGWFLVAGSVATLVGAVAATTTLALVGGDPSGSVFVQWWGRNLVGMLTVGAAGHLLIHAVVTRRGLSVPVRRLPELALLVLASLVAFVLIDLDRSQPIGFLLIATSVWCALRFPTVVAALHVVATAAVSAVLTTLGHGPLSSAAVTPASALAIQAFVLTLLLTSLAIGTTRDERTSLLDELGEAQREAAVRAEFLEAVTEGMTEGLVVYDAQGVVLRMNGAASDLLGRTATGASPGTHTADYLARRPDGSDLTGEEHPATRALTEGVVPAEDLLLPLEDGTARTLAVTATALTGAAGEGPEAAPIGSVVVFRDVTEERRRADRLAEFAATAAHDLRSPLTALTGWLEMAAETDDPVVVAALSRAEGAATRMQHLITDLLDQAAAEGGMLRPEQLEEVDLDDAVDDVRAYLPDGAVVRVAPGTPGLCADRDMLGQLLTNLLGNAAKYTAPGTRPEITVTAERSGDRVEVAVADNGIGIPDAERGRVFERLHRAHAADDRYSGTGLGLAICRTIVVRHGGAISCDAAPGGGTVFRFDLPGTQVETAADLAEVAPVVLPGASPTDPAVDAPG